MRFPDFLDKQTLATPDVIAVTFGDHDYSYREIRDKSRAVAGALNASGIPPRAKVASWLTNCPAFFAIQTGIHRAVRLDADQPARHRRRMHRQYRGIRCKMAVH